MSLINDALRRSKQEKKETLPDNPGGAPMQPVESPRPPGKSSAPIIILLIAIVLLAAGWFFWKGFQAKSESTPAVAELPATPSTAAQEILAEKAPAQLPVESATKPTVVPAVTENFEPETTKTAAPPASSQETNPVTPPPPPIAVPPPPPELKLQGIFYRVTNPTALINGVTVSVGEKIDGARVLNIDRQEVTVERDGQTNVLRMR